MFVGIIIPTWHYFDNPFKLQPLNELYLATVLDSRFNGRAKISVIDLRELRREQNWLHVDKGAHFIPEQDIYLYWIAKSADYPEILSVVRQLRHTYPKAKHIAGGTHVDVFPEECGRHFDAMVLGPGEESFAMAIESPAGVYQSDWASVNYNAYPFARRHYLPEAAIVNNEHFEKYGGVRGTSAIFSRGCNFRCAYCIYNVPNTIQRRSPEKIEEEINYLKDGYQIKGVNLRDEICIPRSPQAAVPYLEAIGRCGIIWRGQTRVGASKEILAMASETGCVELAIGVESASQRVLDIVRKKQTLHQVRNTIYLCKRFGIKVKMCLILGLPGEPPNIVDITRKLIEETQPDYVSISGFCPVPGCEIFNNRDYYGIKHIDEDWSQHAHLLYRFQDEEHFGVPFEYERANRWGETLTRAKIIDNIKELQHYARERDMSY